MSERVGLGFDSHRFESGRPLVLGGTRLPFEMGLGGHSDGDILIHAVVDALLGATGRGNIGEWFPDTDAAHKGADSAILLGRVWRDLAAAGWRVVNLDCVVIAEQPRLGPHLGAMRERLAGLLECGPEVVSVKPKTAEGLGFVGQGEGMAALVVVLLAIARPSSPPDASR
jgi:2-C-methyl-D-erythritol 2,4-cyclodiphosphate synthase